MGDCLFLPSVILRDGESILLDDVTIEALEDALNVPIEIIDPDPAGLLHGIEDFFGNSIEVIHAVDEGPYKE